MIFKRAGAGLAAVAMAALMGGCTHLEVNKMTGDTGRAGYAYMLDYTQYEVVVTRTLLACPVGGEPKINLEVAATPSLAPDGEHVYVIDPDSLINAFKTSDISVDYKDGRLVGFNATTVDKTGEVIASAATSAGKIALMASGVPNGFVDGTSKLQLCSPKAVESLKFVKDNKSGLEDQTEALSDARAELTAMTVEYAVKPTAALRAKIAAKSKAIKTAQDKLDALTKAVAAANKFLVDTETFTWPEDSKTFSTGPIRPLRPTTVDNWFNTVNVYAFYATSAPAVEMQKGVLRLLNSGPDGNAALLKLDDAAFAKEFRDLVDPTFQPARCETVVSDSCRSYARLWKRQANAELTKKFADTTEARLSLHLTTRSSYGGVNASKNAAQGARAGLRYRVPAAGVLTACQNEGPCSKGDDKFLNRFPGPVAQLGAIFNLPFDSPIFASGGVSISFDDQGRLLKASLKRENSQALAAAGALSAVTDQVVAYDKAREGEELTRLRNAQAIAKARKELQDAEFALTKTPTQLLNEELAYVEAQQKLETAKAVLPPSQAKADLTRQIEIAKLEVDLAEQNKKLLEDPNTDLQEVKARYDAEAAVTNARKASVQADEALVKAERALAKTIAGDGT